MARHYNRAHLYSSARMFIRVISRDDAFELLEARPPRARRLSKPQERQLIIQLIERNPHLEGEELRPLLGARGPLSLTDMLANGLGRAEILPRKAGRKIWDDHTGRRRRAIGNRVDQAMTKVEMWPLVGDTKAVRVGPRA